MPTFLNGQGLLGSNACGTLNLMLRTKMTRIGKGEWNDRR